MSEQLKQNYEAARTERKALETELAELPAKVATATSAGDVTALLELRLRRDELPAVYGAASNAESEAREAWLAAESISADGKAAELATQLDEIKTEITEKEAAHVAEIGRLARLEAETAVKANQAKYYADSMKSKLLEGRAGHRRAIQGVQQLAA